MKDWPWRLRVTKPFVVGTEPETQDAVAAGRPPDWKEREQALDIRQSWIVEAPAGSGKTGLLIQRYLKLLGDESVDQPEQVLAITFTVKATGEIRERVMEQLEGAARDLPFESDSKFERDTRALAEIVLQRDRQFGWELLERPRRLRVRTIDSVCAEIAGSLPVLSGSGGGLSPVPDASGLHLEAARRTLMQFGGSDTALNTALEMVLLHRDGNLPECERLLAEMLALRDQWGELVPLNGRELDDSYLDTTVLPLLERGLEQAICAGLTRLSQSLPAGILEELASYAGELGHANGYKGEVSPIAICAGLHTAPEETAEHLAHWRALIHLLTKNNGDWRSGYRSDWLGFEIDKADAARLKNLTAALHENDDALAAIRAVQCLPPAKYPLEQWVVAKALFRVLSRALVELQLLFAERGECDFAELGLLAKTALRSEGGMRDLEATLGMKLQHLLVDEMQDTSTSQYELIELLTQSWDGHSQTLFLVGDPKQSIYLFRQARVERFIRTMQTGKIGDLPIGCLRLTANFRSQRGLVEAFNEDFLFLFPRNLAGGNSDKIEYLAADAVRGPSKTESLNVLWHGNRLPLADTALRRQRAKADARAIREIVERWRARPLPDERKHPWSIAVLVRNRSHLIDIVSALKGENGVDAIPYRAIDIEALGECREVLDLFALTRALLHPADRVAWLAVLHAPWCGLGLAELHLLAGADDETWAERCMEDVIAERAHLLDDESCLRLARIWPVLQAASAQRDRLTTAQWVERTWRSLGGDAYLKPGELANARRYLQLLDEIQEHAGTINLTQLKTRLDKLYAEGASTGAVDLMTIHGAKGLEWDVVIVPGIEKKARVSGRYLLTWNEIDTGDETAAHIALAPIVGKGEASRELNDWLNSIEKSREAAERKRLFYVACTRAREELHLFAAPEVKLDGAVNLAHGSLLSAAWPAAKRHFTVRGNPQDKLREITLLPDEAGRPLLPDGAFVGDLAAVAHNHAAVLERLPLSFSLGSRFTEARRLFYGDVEPETETSRFARPEGSFEARAFGNAVHSFLELVTRQLAQATGGEEMLREVAGWGPRISSVLRSDGLSAARVERLTERVKTALENMLQDPEGFWILSHCNEAASELALTSWDETRRSVRLDRVFRAGAMPQVQGNDYLWIVDYKTTAHGREGIEAFLAGESKKYGTQMEAYARIMKQAPGKMRLALYYPMIPRLCWWVPAPD